MTAPSVATVASTSSGASSVDTLDVPYPSGIQAGDLLVGHPAVRRDTGETLVSDGDVFAKLVEDHVSNLLTAAGFQRDATGSESGSATFNTTVGSHRMVGAILRIVDHGGIEDFAVNSGDSTQFTIPSVTSEGADRLWVALIAQQHNSGLDFDLSADGFTEHYSEQGSGAASNQCRIVGFSKPVGSGATGTVTSNEGTSSRPWVAISLLVAPETVAADEIILAAHTVHVTHLPFVLEGAAGQVEPAAHQTHVTHQALAVEGAPGEIGLAVHPIEATHRPSVLEGEAADITAASHTIRFTHPVLVVEGAPGVVEETAHQLTAIHLPLTAQGEDTFTSGSQVVQASVAEAAVILNIHLVALAHHPSTLEGVGELVFAAHRIVVSHLPLVLEAEGDLTPEAHRVQITHQPLMLEGTPGEIILDSHRVNVAHQPTVLESAGDITIETHSLDLAHHPLVVEAEAIIQAEAHRIATIHQALLAEGTAGELVLAAHRIGVVHHPLGEPPRFKPQQVTTSVDPQTTTIRFDPQDASSRFDSQEVTV